MILYHERLLSDNGHALVQRIYTRKGQRWPRIAIGISDNILGSPGFIVACSEQQNVDCRWVRGGIPYELHDEVITMLAEFIKRKAQAHGR